MALRWIYSDPYIAYRIPKIRRQIMWSYFFRMSRAIYFIAILPFIIPLWIIRGLGHVAEIIADLIAIPNRYLTIAHRKAFGEVHNTMSVAEIRYILYGETPPQILPNTIRKGNTDEQH